MSKTELAKAASTAVGAVIDYGEHFGKGFEGQTQADIAIPFIAVLQALSPAVEKIEGAKAGMLFNTVTQEIIKGEDGLLFVPAVTQHVFVEWRKRAAGGGFVEIYAINDAVVATARDAAAKKETETGKKEFGKLETAAGNDLIETFYVYGVLCDGEEPLGMAVVAFTSTKIKVYKKWNTRLRTFLIQGPTGRVNPPLFANLTRIKTFKDKNPKGEFFNLDLGPAVGTLVDSLLKPSDPRFLAAVDCKKLVETGAARAAFETQAGDAGDEDTGDGKIPF